MRSWVGVSARRDRRDGHAPCDERAAAISRRRDEAKRAGGCTRVVELEERRAVLVDELMEAGLDGIEPTDTGARLGRVEQLRSSLDAVKQELEGLSTRVDHPDRWIEQHEGLVVDPLAAPGCPRRRIGVASFAEGHSTKEDTMELYAILRRSGWRSGDELELAAGRSSKVADEQMPDDVRWIRSYVLDEAGGSVGTVCIYEATSPEAIRKHASLADLPVDEIVRVVDTVIVRPDPQPATT